MPSPGFEGLKIALSKAGVSPVYIQRTILELGEHWEDLMQDAVAAGMTAEEAARWADAALGTEETIAAAVLSRPELRGWTYRWPWLAVCLRCLAQCAALPLVPVTVCWNRGALIARWAVSVMLALVLTSSLFFYLNSLIILP
ncbi:MAG TPA: hypothetical protein VIN61_18050 [Gammaproteobacteria bacterium]